MARDYRAENLWTRYRLTPSDYAKLLIAQDGRCGICREPQNEGETLHVDHCHTSGNVRGLLCNSCNLGIAHMAEDPRRLHSAAVYLINHQQTQEPPSEPR